MSESSSSQTPKKLDPSAEEFHPTPLHLPIFITPPPLLPTFFQPLPPPPPPPQLFVPYLPPPPPTTYLHILHPPPPPPNLTPPPATTNAPSRTLLLTSIPPYATEDSIRTELDGFGEIRAVEMDRVYEGIVSVHFYDLRDAQIALREIRAQHFQGCPVWAQFVIHDDPLNHGTIVVFNLDPHVPDHTLMRIFKAFGPVKEIRETPAKRRQKFLEYFDVRHAAKAAIEMNGKMIQRKQISIDFSRPGGGQGRRWRPSAEFDEYHQSKFRQPTEQLPTSRKPAHSSNIEDNATAKLCLARRPTSTTSDGGTNTTVVDSMSSSGNVNDRTDTVSDKNVVRKVSVNKPWAGKAKKRLMESRFMIKEDVITCFGDMRTTLMIKNIPNKYSQKLLLSLLDNHCAHCNDQILSGKSGAESLCLSSYDFVYLPMDFNNKCNVGYGFVNMTSPEATFRLYKAFHRQSWEVFNSRKICEVTYARVQGLEALKEHFRNSKFPPGSDEIFPVCFEPPRDGRRQLTSPQPIYGLTSGSSENPQPIYGLMNEGLMNGSSENGTSTSSSCRSSDESSQGCVNEVYLEQRVAGDVTEVEQTAALIE